MKNKNEWKTVIMEYDAVQLSDGETQWVEEYPSKFVAYEKNCPSCDGAGTIEMSPEEDSNWETWHDTCDYCNGEGELKCHGCREVANFSTEKGFLCWNHLDKEYKDAFTKENPDFKPELVI